jgi:hypothetical protein
MVWLTDPTTGFPFNSHWFPEGEEEERITLLPGQKVTGPPAVMTGMGGLGLTVISTESSLFIQPPAMDVMLYLTTSAVAEELVRVWAIVAPVPGPYPVVAVPGASSLAVKL